MCSYMFPEFRRLLARYIFSLAMACFLAISALIVWCISLLWQIILQFAASGANQGKAGDSKRHLDYHSHFQDCPTAQAISFHHHMRLRVLLSQNTSHLTWRGINIVH